MEAVNQSSASVDCCYKFSSFPQTYQEAMESPESSSWKVAMREEMDSLNENNTFTLTILPEGKHSVGGRWVHTVKEISTGGKTFKARYVAKGYSQVKGIDYQETFAPTANLTSLRVLMQIAAQKDLILHQMVVKTAYLNAPIDVEIFMDQAEGFEVPSESNGRQTKEMMKKGFHMKDLGKLSYFLGIHFEQGDGFVTMNQKRYLTKVLERFEMSDCKLRATPSEQKLEFSSGEVSFDPRRYREAVGSLIYAMTCTRPDIC